MNISLIGYGKMGKAIAEIARSRGHNVALIIDVDNLDAFTRENLRTTEVAIEFTSPLTAFENVMRCLEYGVPVVCGSTGWYARLGEAREYCIARSGSMLCTSNFSLGVNLFFELNRHLAQLMRRFPDYRASIEETHHTRKLDAPSGTAISLAEGIIDVNPDLKGWALADNGSTTNDSIIPIRAIRKDDIPGTHRITYSSTIDDIDIVHTAHSRQGFAMGAVLAAEYIHNKQGVFSMKDLLFS